MGNHWSSICASILLLFSMSVTADGTEIGKVKNIIVESTNIISVTLEGVDHTADCAGGGRWTISTSDPLYKEKYAAILTAANTGKTITLFHLSSWGCGTWDSNKVYYVNTNY